MSALFKTVKSFVASDGSVHATLNAWKEREVCLALGPNQEVGVSLGQAENIVANADKVIAILRQRERKPRTPAVKKTAAKRTRKPKVAVNAESVTA